MRKNNGLINNDKMDHGGRKVMFVHYRSYPPPLATPFLFYSFVLLHYFFFFGNCEKFMSRTLEWIQNSILRVAHAYRRRQRYITTYTALQYYRICRYLLYLSGFNDMILTVQWRVLLLLKNTICRSRKLSKSGIQPSGRDVTCCYLHRYYCHSYITTKKKSIILPMQHEYLFCSNDEHVEEQVTNVKDIINTLIESRRFLQALQWKYE